MTSGDQWDWVNKCLCVDYDMGFKWALRVIQFSFV